jgi:hypothetical protein
MIIKAGFLKKGKLDYMEFLMATINLKSELTDHVLHQTFEYLNTTKKGFIAASDLMETMRRMGMDVTEAEVKSMLSDYHLPSDGSISFEQFKQIMLADQTPKFGETQSPYPKALDAISGTPMKNTNRAFQSPDFGFGEIADSWVPEE